MQAHRIRPILYIAALLLFTAFFQPKSTATSFYDSARINCSTSGDDYLIEYEVTVTSRRLILIGVIDTRGNGHRVFRYYLKDGQKSGEISIDKSRYGPLKRACIAVHATGRNGDTVASDCDYF